MTAQDRTTLKGYFADARNVVESNYRDMVESFDLIPAVTSYTIDVIGQITLTGESGIERAIVDTYNSTSVDDLQTIMPGNMPTGGILILRCSNVDRDVIVKDSSSMRLQGDMRLSVIQDSLTLCYLGSNIWQEVSRNYEQIPSVRAFATSLSAISSGAWTAIPLNSELWDTHGFHSTSVNTSRLTVPSGCDGLYQITANIRLPGPIGDCLFGLEIYRNNTHSIARQTHIAYRENLSDLLVTTLWPLDAAEYVEMRVYQNSGSSITPGVNNYYSPQLMMSRVGYFPGL